MNLNSLPVAGIACGSHKAHDAHLWGSAGSLEMTRYLCPGNDGAADLAQFAQVPFSEAPEAQPETEAQYYQTGLMIEVSKVPYVGCHRAPDTRVARVWRALTGR